jgi:hypothetical protein
VLLFGPKGREPLGPHAGGGVHFGSSSSGSSVGVGLGVGREFMDWGAPGAPRPGAGVAFAGLLIGRGFAEGCGLPHPFCWLLPHPFCWPLPHPR